MRSNLLIPFPALGAGPAVLVVLQRKLACIFLVSENFGWCNSSRNVVKLSDVALRDA